MLIFLLSLIPALIRTYIVNRFGLLSIDPNIWAIIPDILFFIVCVFWLLKIAKIKFDCYIIIYLMIYLGSIIWDYQNGFYFLKAILPFILFTIINRDKIKISNLKSIISFYLPIIIFPFLILWKTILKIKDNKEVEKKKKLSFYFKSGISGILIGLVIFVLLIGLDPEFAKFVNIDSFKKFWQFTGKFIGSILFYEFCFIVFFWLPIKAFWDKKEDIPCLEKLIQTVVVVSTAIVVGYSFYDIYISLRAFKLVDFKFESMGKNAQMQYLEMVFLGGFWLFYSSYIIGKLLYFWDENKKKVAKFISWLIISLVWLLPPLLNILRVLLNVYIPEFGLTIKRLFGLYTVIAFLSMFWTMIMGYIQRDKWLFVKSLLVFSLSLCFLCFVLPNNLIVASWHFNKYLKGENLETKIGQNNNIDFEYLEKIKLNKWAWILMLKLDGDKYISDNTYGAMWARQMRRKGVQKKYTDKLINKVREDIVELDKLVMVYDFKTVAEKYGQNLFWYYDGKIENYGIQSSLYTCNNGGMLSDCETNYANVIKRIENGLNTENRLNGFALIENYQNLPLLFYTVNYDYYEYKTYEEIQNDNFGSDQLMTGEIDQSSQKFKVKKILSKTSDLFLKLNTNRIYQTAILISDNNKTLDNNYTFKPFLVSNKYIDENCINWGEDNESNERKYPLDNIYDNFDGNKDAKEACSIRKDELNFPIIPEFLFDLYTKDMIKTLCNNCKI